MITEPYWNHPEDWSAGRRKLAHFLSGVPEHAQKVLSLGQTRLFHGSGSDFNEGDVIDPTTHASGKTGAWATSDYEIAAHYAGNSARNNNALFHPIYEVEPLEGDTLTKVDDNFKSDKGLRVKGIAGYADYEGKPLKD